MHTYNNVNISDSAASELLKLEVILEQELSKGSPFITKEALRVLKSGGKRLRPLLTILFSMTGKQYESERTLYAAAAIETMHMATLVHDDTIDNAGQRRGIDTTFKKHGIHTAVYTGDWMLLKSLQMLAKTGEPDSVTTGLLNTLASGMEFVCNGEIDQYFGRGKIPAAKTYFQRIRGKTAALFGASCAAGAKLAGLSDDMIRYASGFGENFGIAFQIRDDMIDMVSTDAKAGKPVENDLREGIITLPVLLACNESKAFKARVRTFLADPDHSSVSPIIRDTIANGGLVLARQKCDAYITECYRLTGLLPQCQATDDLKHLLTVVFPDFANT
ncbi:MAG: polyprenyl synthetase family protein [Saccharofermentanales bacterium]